MTEQQGLDFSLYLVTDRILAMGRSVEEVVLAAVRGGVTCVQLREKEGSTRELLELALRIREPLRDAGIPLIINDRLDIAMAAGADGVHLGQKDLPLEKAREIAPKGMIIGISAESVEDAAQAEAGGADYVGVSPVFLTPTKRDTARPQGLEGVRRFRESVGIPVVGIGGINRSNAGEVIRAGADGVAVVSAIMSAPDPERAARELLTLIKEVEAE